MLIINRSSENPILIGESRNPWEAEGAFNGCPIKNKDGVHLFYRAQSSPILHSNVVLEVSSVGYASSEDGMHFKKHRQFITPEFDWERFGCEDPRVVKLNNKYYIFYTALSTFPFGPDGISVGLAISKNLKKVDEKHHITPFNAKAMSLFPAKIKGKMAALLTANTDRPPSKIALAIFDKEEDLWSEEYWNAWYCSLDNHTVPLQRNPDDHVELGAPPIKTKDGWLLIYSYIKNYLKEKKVFGIEAVLLDLDDPRKILGRTEVPMMVPEEEYELYGKVPNIVFPSGALVKGKKLQIYYGAADSTCCVASCELSELIAEMLGKRENYHLLERFEGNPILEPIKKHAWENKAVFNPAAIRENGMTHILYRATSADDTSSIGYASSVDGLHIDKRLPKPIYAPKEAFEKKMQGGNSGCEDPRVTKIGDKIYMCYTAVDAKSPPRVALTSISLADFVAQKWNWSKSKLISPPGYDDKDVCILPEKVRGKYVIFHRIQPSIDINFFDDLDFTDGKILEQNPILLPRKGMWDDKKIGINTVPLKTKKGWLLLYHGVSEENSVYRIGAALLDLHEPEKVLARSKFPILEPEMDYEKEGVVPNVVFPCGMVAIGARLFVYYGGADKVVGVATMSLNKLLKSLV
ncbi:MAG: hypothetical protein WC848_04055 [Parcubacteria group bacterium]|jgi:predicted GH43/DUF377 family glycosyl hydrolase